MITVNHTVVGMTCDHCVRSVTEEVGEIPGVTDVDVDLTSGRLTVSSRSPLERRHIAEAVAEAGYELD